MDLEIPRFGAPVLLISNSLPKCTYFPYNRDGKLAQNADGDGEFSESPLIESVFRDDKAALVTHAKRFAKAMSGPLGRSTVSELLHLCCNFDSPNCAAALLGGELGTTPLVNEVDEASGKSPLHTAALAHAARCVEVLVKKHARTGLRTRDGRAQLALDLSLSSTRMDVIWTPDDYTVEDLVAVLGVKDLTTVRLLSDKTKELGEVAYANAVEGRIVALAALLIVAGEKVNESVLELRDKDSGSKEKGTLYECVIQEALSLVRPKTPLTAARRTSTAADGDSSQKRRLLLLEIELLQLFGAVAQSVCTDKKVTSPLIQATQVGDEAIIQLLLKTNIDVNDADAEGNSALHWTLKMSKLSCTQQMRILCLLIEHGARVSQRNKLGLTAFHIAAGNGNAMALQVLLLEDPDGIQYKTEIKETPLFFAVRNESMECVELLLRWGANSEILNLRQRPIDLTTSQDMRFILLNPTSGSLSKNALAKQHKCAACSQCNEALSSTCEALLAMTDEDTTTERKIHSSAEVQICKYFDSPRGCVRGAKCFYAHGMEDRRKVKQGAVRNHCSDAKELKRIFVGGLPPTVDSDSLGRFFEKQFGPVDDSIVILAQTENKLQSRGFGFVTFKEEKSVSAAVEAHYVTMVGKAVEIKSIIPRLAAELEKMSSRQQEQEKNCQSQLPAQMSSNEMTMEANKPEQGSWVGKLLHGQPKTSPIKPQAHVTNSLKDQSMPTWLKIFKEWFPGFLQDLSKHPKSGQYALSSLKGDFRFKFGLELDHAHLGFSKLSDFIKSFPKLCTIKAVPSGQRGNINHTVLLPKLRPHHQLSHTHRMPCTDDGGNSNCLQVILTNDGGDSKCVQDISTEDSGDSKCVENILTDDGGNTKCVEDISVNDGGDSKCHQDLPIDDGRDSKCHQDLGLKGTSYGAEEHSNGLYPEVNSVKDISHCVESRVLQFLKPDPVFLGQKEYDVDEERGQCVVGNEGSTNDQQRHLVLEALARKRNKSSGYFLRDFDFYQNYKECILERKCLGCNQNQMLWANFPCQHLLWCSACKEDALRAAAAGDFAHKCVVCDAQVQKIILLPRLQLHQEFPPIHDPGYLPTSFMSKASLLMSIR